MPTYEFKCECGHLFEVFEMMSKAKHVMPCPKCGKGAKRQIGRGAPPLLPGSAGFMPYKGT